MKRKSMILSCVMVFCLMVGVFSANAAYDIALEATDGETVQTIFTPGGYLYLNINLAADSGGVAGCAFTLTYPADKLELENPTNPGNLPDSASTPDITSIFPFMTAEKYTRCENSSESGKIMFAGAEIDPENGGSKFHYIDTTFFTVKFKVKSTASGAISFELMQTTLTNADAGWNGEGVPVVVGALPNTDANFGGDLSDDFPVLLENFASNPTLTVQSSVTNPYEEWKAANGYNDPDIGGPAEDYDHDGFSNDQERLNGSDPTLETGNTTGVDVTDSSTWTAVGPSYNALEDFRVSNLDIDGSGEATLGGDAMLLVRYLAGFSGANLLGDSVDTANCTRCTADEISAYVDAVEETVYDVDGSGQPTLGGDAMLIIRHAAGFTGDNMLGDSVDTEYCTRCTSDEISGWIDLLFPQ
ncbi:MAG: hypothetical protein GY749_41545 [Desulfobacteraceae bacterium]|nr:hypothetical protein [Desulfobacteraceae bacterium]